MRGRIVVTLAVLVLMATVYAIVSVATQVTP